MRSDLERELSSAALSVTQLDLARCRWLGLLNPGVAEMGRAHHQFGVSAVENLGGGLYQPADSGPRRLIVPVFEDWTLIDLVAVSSAEPDDWLVRTGESTALGLADGWHHRWFDPVPVHRNPIDWLRAGGDGLCVIDWKSPHLDRLRDLPGIAVTNVDLAEKLKLALTRPRPIPPIIINEGGSPLMEAA